VNQADSPGNKTEGRTTQQREAKKNDNNKEKYKERIYNRLC
jgi:hypothetical protein